LEKIAEIHEQIFDLLENYRKTEEKHGNKFFYTLRKSNRNKRLEKGYWFLGDDSYLAVSFWNGFDWKNKTPNIFFAIDVDENSFVTFTARDSSKKVEQINSIFLEKFGFESEGLDKWTSTIDNGNYLNAFKDFLLNDKLIIDKLIEDNSLSLEAEDKSNSIGFLEEEEFKKCLLNIEKYRSEDFSNENKLPFSLKAFRVKNFDPIEDASFGKISLNTPFIFIVGENGSGKTSLMKSIAIALENGAYDPGYMNNDTTWKIDFTINHNGSSVPYSISKNTPYLDEKLKVPFAAYGPFRLVTDNQSSFLKLDHNNPYVQSESLWSLFDPYSILKDITSLTSDTGEKSDEIIKKNNDRFEIIKSIIIEIVPNLYDIRKTELDGPENLRYYEYDSKEKKIFEYDFNGQKKEKGVYFYQTSSGLKSLIAMLGDMMLRLFIKQPSITDPAELEGIVLIDEVDIHLHPKWQRKIPEILNKNFPKIQFILTTHSPIPLLGAPKNSRIYLIKRTTEKGVVIERMDDKVEFGQLLPNSILTSPIFGLEDITPDSKDETKQTEVEDNYDEIKFYEKIEIDVNKYLTNSKQKELINLFKKK